jgi:hypothetical protein
MDISPDDKGQSTWYSVGTNRVKDFEKGGTAMESVMLTVKFVLFLAMEIFVVATIGGTLILVVYEIVKRHIQRSKTFPMGRTSLPTRTGWY